MDFTSFFAWTFQNFSGPLCIIYPNLIIFYTYNIEPAPSDAFQEGSQPSIPANEEIPSASTTTKNVASEFNSPFRDSPFFKVPLPPQPIKKAFTLRKFVASSNLRQNDKSVVSNKRWEPIEKLQDTQRVTPLYSFQDSPDNNMEEEEEDFLEAAPSSKKRSRGRSVVEEPEVIPPKASSTLQTKGGRGRPKKIVETEMDDDDTLGGSANRTSSARKRKKSNSRSSKEDKSPPKKQPKVKKAPPKIVVENEDDDESDNQIPELNDSPPAPPPPPKKKPKLKKPPPKIVVEDEESDNQDEATNEDIPEPSGNNQLAKDDDEPSDNIEDYRFLVNWIPKLKGKKMIVEGDLYDFT